jgi:hypothetical protein
VRHHVAVVLVVQLQRRGEVEVDDAVAPPAAAGGAPRPEPRPQRGVHRRVQLRVQPGGREGRAVGAPDGVRPRQRHQVVGAQVLGREAAQELRQVEGRRRQVGRGLRRVRHAPVQPPRRHREPDAAHDARRVARRERHDVRARHRPGAPPLHHALRAADHAEPAQAREVGRGRLLHRPVPRAARRVVQQHRRVASLSRSSVALHCIVRLGWGWASNNPTYPDEAVVEEEPDQARPVAGVLADGGVDDGLDEALGGRAAAVVVPHLQLRRLRGVEACHRHRHGRDELAAYMGGPSSGLGAHRRPRPAATTTDRVALSSLSIYLFYDG